MNPIIFVVGMHRSGTSAMAGALEKLGAYTGGNEELLRADQHNARGYFERKDIVTCNEQILSEAFIKSFPDVEFENIFNDIDSLDSYGWIFGAWANQSNVFTEHSASTIQSCLNRSYANQPNKERPILIKDPRVSITIPVWQKQAGCHNPVIIMVRDPENVYRSLNCRDGLLHGLSYELWARYTRSAITNTKCQPRILVNYDTFIASPETTLEKVVDFLSVHNVTLNRTSIPDCASFVSKDLRHQNIQTQNNFVSNSYEQLIQLGLDESDSVDFSYLCDPYTWEKGLIVLTRIKNNRLKILEDRIRRIAVHPVIGRIIRMAQIIKRDDTFGSLR